MTKRAHAEVLQNERPSKRRCCVTVDRLSNISDEILLRILSYASVPELCLCQRISRRFYTIAGDSQLWKAAYYNRFVRPRASRLPGIKDATTNHLLFSSKLSKWLDEENLVKRGKETNWKRQYKLRHNWSNGSCNVSEIQVAEQPPVPPLLVRFHEGIVFTVDATTGLRAWAMKEARHLLASKTLNADGNALPTSLAVDIQDQGSRCYRVTVGFQDGGFAIYELHREPDEFVFLYSHTASSNGTLSAVAYASPYLLTMTAGQLLSLYKFPVEPEGKRSKEILDPPRLLYSLKSHTAWPPLSLSIRPSPEGIVASIAYAIATYLSGWSVGIQELRLTSAGQLVESRTATSAYGAFQSLSSASSLRQLDAMSPLGNHSPYLESDPVYSKPTSLSYTHPYLLVSHPDNTLTLYLVTSTSSTLSISPGSRLWGHTSSVSGAHVGGKGKAVSVSSRGDELRVWELEGGIASAVNKRRLATGDLSVQIRPEKKASGNGNVGLIPNPTSQKMSGLGLTAEHKPDDMSVSRGWIGFDEENVIVLRERLHGSQALVVYDFT